MLHPQRPPSQAWRTFLKNHAEELMALDFFTVPTATFRVLFVLILLTHSRRRLEAVEAGQNFVLERRHAEGRLDRLPDLAAELVALKVDAIFARSSHAVRSARNATRTIPIIAADLESDPVAMGFVAALAKPGGNVRGIFLDLPEVSATHVQFLTDVALKLSRVAVLGDPTINASHFKAVHEAALVHAVRVQALEAKNEMDVDRALGLAIKERAGALIVFSSSFMFLQRIKIAAAAIKNKLAAIALWREFVEVGGLMSYGADLLTLHRQCAAYVDKVLQGIRPRELPVERPAKFQFALNMKTAKALGLTIAVAVAAGGSSD